MTKHNPVEGGKGDNKSLADFDPKEVEMGIRVEMEHTDDRSVAEDIVKDHLTEDPHYYSKLKSAGLADELKEAVLNDISLFEAKQRKALLDVYGIKPDMLRQTQDPTLTIDQIKRLGARDVIANPEHVTGLSGKHILDINAIRAGRDDEDRKKDISTIQATMLKLSANS